ncbi:MAG: hypothetical protein WCP35_16685, partial [Verrucomicrobiota bacterium]
ERDHARQIYLFPEDRTPDPLLTEASRLKAFGYSRDKRPDCVQIVIALIITPDGLPIGYEVMRGSPASVSPGDNPIRRRCLPGRAGRSRSASGWR